MPNALRWKAGQANKSETTQSRAVGTTRALGPIGTRSKEELVTQRSDWHSARCIPRRKLWSRESGRRSGTYQCWLLLGATQEQRKLTGNISRNGGVAISGLGPSACKGGWLTQGKPCGVVEVRKGFAPLSGPARANETLAAE